MEIGRPCLGFFGSDHVLLVISNYTEIRVGTILFSNIPFDVVRREYAICLSGGLLSAILIMDRSYCCHRNLCAIRRQQAPVAGLTGGLAAVGLLLGCSKPMQFAGFGPEFCRCC